jgi:hypothetical protein
MVRVSVSLAQTFPSDESFDFNNDVPPAFHGTLATLRASTDQVGQKIKWSISLIWLRTIVNWGQWPSV